MIRIKLRDTQTWQVLQSACGGPHLADYILSFIIPKAYSQYELIASGLIELIDIGLKNQTLSSNRVLEYATRVENQEKSRDLVSLAFQYGETAHGACNHDEALENAYAGGNTDYITFIESHITYPNYQYAMRGACRGGHRALIAMLLEKKATHFHYAMTGAAENGDLNLIRYLTDINVPEWSNYWQYTESYGLLSILDLILSEWGCPSRDFSYHLGMGGHIHLWRISRYRHAFFKGLCRNGWIEYAKIIYNELRERHNPALHLLLHDAAALACEVGRVEIVKWLISAVETDYDIEFNYRYIIKESCFSGRWELVNLCLDNISNANDCVYLAIIGACRGGWIDILVKVFELYTHHPVDFEGMAYNICLGGHWNILHWFENRFHDASIDWTSAYLGACRGGHYELVQYILSTYTIDHWNFGLIEACRYGHSQLIVDIVQEKMVWDYTYALKTLAEFHHFKLLLNLHEMIKDVPHNDDGTDTDDEDDPIPIFF